MGGIISSLQVLLFGKEIRVLILGLDAAGKTTILYRLQCGEIVSTQPTVGFNVETVKYKNLNFQVWDLGGQKNIRPYWRCYYSNTDALIYVVDSSDIDRLSISKQELFSILEEDELKDCPLLVYANKQDLEASKSVTDISLQFSLDNLKNRQWQIFKCSALNGTGLNEGLDWLSNAIKNNF